MRFCTVQCHICTPKDIAEPMLYRETILVEPLELLKFATCVIFRRLRKNSDPGRWVRTFMIEMDWDEYAQHDVSDFKLATLLSHLPNLEMFSCTGMSCSQDELISLRCSSHPVLRSLEFTVRDRHASPGLVLSIIGHMHTLRVLNITLYGSEAPIGGRHPLSAVPGLELPQLIRLHWACEDQHPGQLLAFLGRSRFPMLREFSVKLPTGRSAAVNKLPELCAFVHAHSGITELKVENTSERLDNELLDKARHITRFETVNSMLCVGTIEHLPVTCRALAFGWIDRDSTEEVGAIAERLEALPAVAQSLREIHITDGFLWNRSLRLNLSDDEAMLHGQMLHVAARLHKMGICLRDGDGAIATVVIS
jgi:hypothetical protein